jgi:phosphate:Na+ symporter
VSTAIAILGGVGLFLLGMTVMTDGVKVLAGTILRTVLSKAAARALSGDFWDAIITLPVQSSSATTMTTIGLVNAGLLSFPQGLGLVFDANVSTAGTGRLALGLRAADDLCRGANEAARGRAHLLGAGNRGGRAVSLAGVRARSRRNRAQEAVR